MIEFIKEAPIYSHSPGDEVRTTVSAILSAVERDGIEGVRHFSRQLDRWDPESFLVDAKTISKAEEAVTPELKEHIQLAQEQVRNFAVAQRATLLDLEIETLPGILRCV